MKKIVFLLALVVLVGFGCSSKPTNERLVDDKAADKEVRKNSELCEQVNDDGSFPISETYENLPALGQLFTASHCEGDRIEALPSVENGTYTAGATIWLPTVADAELTQTFRDLGFTCSGGNEDTCKKWRLTEERPVEDMLRLRTFAPQMATDECINC